MSTSLNTAELSLKKDSNLSGNSDQKVVDTKSTEKEKEKDSKSRSSRSFVFS